MRTLAVFFALFLTVFLVTSLHAQTPVIYDDFNGKLLDPGKWFSVDSSSQNGTIVLEDGLKIKTEPIYGYKGLNMNLRAYGDVAINVNTKAVWKQIYITNSTGFASGIKTMQATVQVKSLQLTGCTANTTPTDTRIRIGGAFFKDGPSTPGNATNDVHAWIGIGAKSDDTTLLVRAGIFQCLDATCSDSTTLWNEDVGTTKLNKKTKISLTWDPDNDRFAFQVGKGAVVYGNYSVSDTTPPNTSYGGSKRLQIKHNLANCTSDRTTAALDVFVEDVKIYSGP